MKKRSRIKVMPRDMTPPSRVRLMWAYGSNLSHAQMRRRCPEAKPLQPLYLEHGVLTFRGFADVEYRKGGVIAGGLWKISPRCIPALDKYEGVYSKLYEKKYLLLEVDGKPERCLYYRMLPGKNDELGVMPPWDSYLDKIVQGYRDFNLNDQLLDEALARAWGEKEKTEDVMRRWRSNGKPRLVRIKEERA